jgi:hypothetical protein
MRLPLRFFDLGIVPGCQIFFLEKRDKALLGV